MRNLLEMEEFDTPESYMIERCHALPNLVNPILRRVTKAPIDEFVTDVFKLPKTELKWVAYHPDQKSKEGDLPKKTNIDFTFVDENDQDSKWRLNVEIKWDLGLYSWTYMILKWGNGEIISDNESIPYGSIFKERFRFKETYKGTRTDINPDATFYLDNLVKTYTEFSNSVKAPVKSSGVKIEDKMFEVQMEILMAQLEETLCFIAEHWFWFSIGDGEEPNKDPLLKEIFTRCKGIIEENSNA